MLLGGVHNLVEWLQSRRATPPELQEAEKVMKAAIVKAPRRAVPLYDFMKGFSFMMGYLLMAYGALNLALASQAVASNAAMAVNVAVCTVGVGVSLRYFFIVPTAFLGLSGAAYLAAWLIGSS